MTLNSEPPRLSVSLSSPPSGPGWLARALGAIAAVALLVLGVVFSAVLFAVVAVVGLVAFGWFWWRTREARRQWREAMAGRPGQGAGAPDEPDASSPGGARFGRPPWRRGPAEDVSDAKVLAEESRPHP